jgi:hypothetical protein
MALSLLSFAPPILALASAPLRTLSLSWERRRLAARCNLSDTRRLDGRGREGEEEERLKRGGERVKVEGDLEGEVNMLE